MIMNIKGKDSEYPLFASVDRKWNGQGYNFSFHPSKLIEANMTTRELYPRLAHEHGEENMEKRISKLSSHQEQWRKDVT